MWGVPLSERPEDRRWSSYWAEGHVHSLGRAYEGGNYGGRVRDFWWRVFDRLPDGARVLDICSGNGAVALLALEYAREHGKAFEVHAVDRADIDPERAIGREAAAAIRFRGGVAVESLPFEAACLDLVTAQYGLEYTDPERSVPELARVLRPGGRLAVVHHHPDSHIIRTARAERSLIGHLLATDGPLTAADTLLARLQAMESLHDDGAAAMQALRGDDGAERARGQLNQAVARLQQQVDTVSGGAAPLLAEVLERLRGLLGRMGRQPADELRQGLNALRCDYEDNNERLGDLLACHMTRDSFALAPRLADAGFLSEQAGNLEEEVDGRALLLGAYWHGKLREAASPAA